jgi:hypothetical protein
MMHKGARKRALPPRRKVFKIEGRLCFNGFQIGDDGRAINYPLRFEFNDGALCKALEVISCKYFIFQKVEKQRELASTISEAIAPVKNLCEIEQIEPWFEQSATRGHDADTLEQFTPIAGIGVLHGALSRAPQTMRGMIEPPQQRAIDDDILALLSRLRCALDALERCIGNQKRRRVANLVMLQPVFLCATYTSW